VTFNFRGMLLVISGACDLHFPGHVTRIWGKLLPMMEHLHGIKNHPLKFPLRMERQHFTPPRWNRRLRCHPHSNAINSSAPKVTSDYELNCWQPVLYYSVMMK